MKETKVYFRTKMIDAKGKWFWGYVTYFFLFLWSYGLDILKYKKQRIQHCIWWPKVEKANSAWNCTLSHKDHRKEKKEAVERRTFNILRAVCCALSYCFVGSVLSPQIRKKLHSILTFFLCCLLPFPFIECIFALVNTHLLQLRHL